MVNARTPSESALPIPYPHPLSLRMLYALLGAVAIGLVLGLLGSGGSILAVPVLVYLADQPEKVAIAESLAIVGAIASVGALTYARQGLVDWKSVLGFGVPGIVGTYAGAALAAYVPGAAQLVLFGIVMILAAGAMLKGRAGMEAGRQKRAAWVVALLGAGVGVMTGLVGVGGGFLIIPALVLLVGLDMRLAVGTSLSIIVLNSATGFLKYLDVLQASGGGVDWTLVGTFAAIGIGGSLVGAKMSQRVPQKQLRRGFAVFLVCMGLFILVQEGPRVFEAEAAPLAQSSLAQNSLAQGDALALAATPLASADTVVVRLSPEDTAALLAETPEAQVVDVRTPEEVAASGTLQGATLLDFNAPDFEARATAALDPDRPVVLYCRSGARAGRAADVLSTAGFADLYNAGGFGALETAGLATE